jgi:hypothetical protein
MYVRFLGFGVCMLYVGLCAAATFAYAKASYTFRDDAGGVLDEGFVLTVWTNASGSFLIYMLGPASTVPQQEQQGPHSAVATAAVGVLAGVEAGPNDEALTMALSLANMRCAAAWETGNATVRGAARTRVLGVARGGAHAAPCRAARCPALQIVASEYTRDACMARQHAPTVCGRAQIGAAVQAVMASLGPSAVRVAAPAVVLTRACLRQRRCLVAVCVPLPAIHAPVLLSALR